MRILGLVIDAAGLLVALVARLCRDEIMLSSVALALKRVRQRP